MQPIAESAPGRAATAFVVAVSWVAAGAVVIGFVWTASTLSPSPPPGTPGDTLPYAVGWTSASLALLASCVGSLFAGGGRRATLVALAAALAVVLTAAAVAANVLR